jgi:hypothetical protein
VNPPTEQFPEGTVTIRLHRRKPQHIIMDRRDVNVVIAEELEMQRTENKHLKTKLGQQARYIMRLEDALRQYGHIDLGSVQENQSPLEVQEDDMCPNCVTPWKCNGPHLLGDVR